jgi:hypothetical protein
VLALAVIALIGAGLTAWHQGWVTSDGGNPYMRKTLAIVSREALRKAEADEADRKARFAQAAEASRRLEEARANATPPTPVVVLSGESEWVSGKAGVIGRPHPGENAPRAEFVRMSVPRAQLVRLPEWRVGETRTLTMPYGTRVRATFRGSVDDELMLPESGNAIGDTYTVRDTTWVWLAAPGAAIPQWVDP